MGYSIVGASVNPISVRMGRMDKGRICKVEGNVAGWTNKRFNDLNWVHTGKRSSHHDPWRLFCSRVSLEEEFSAVQSKKFSKDEESEIESLSEEIIAELPSSEELKASLVDDQRSKLIQKLSESNQHNWFLKRQLQASEDALVIFKSELAVMELEIHALVTLAKEIANRAFPDGSRKINGKYIQSHLLSRLEAVQEKMKEQIKDVVAAQLLEVPLHWSSIAESVQVMGSFDGWSEGEHLSPEDTGLQATFSTKLMLRPGRYEIKFLVDGEWHLSPEFPVVGEGFMQNNLLMVE